MGRIFYDPFQTINDYCNKDNIPHFPKTELLTDEGNFPIFLVDRFIFYSKFYIVEVIVLGLKKHITLKIMVEKQCY